jgi:hypothetical protein
MNARPELNRRQLLQTAALAASALSFMSEGAEPALDDVEDSGWTASRRSK